MFLCSRSNVTTMAGCLLKFLACSAALIVVIEAASVTYPLIGTFTDQDFYDKTWRPFVMLPQSPEHIDPEFALFTRKNQHNPDDLVWNDASEYRSTHFNPKLETKIIVHGFIDSNILGHWMKDMKDAFLTAKDYNVIVVDWSKGDFFPYTQATANTRVVGAMIGVMIQNLCKTYNITPDSFHLLGHSLGAHIMAYAGKFVKGQVGHITGLDPAGPYFEGLTNPAARFWHTDAKFVEAIHTDARHLIPDIGFGMYETCAHVDIYPNGGRNQVGCDQERFTTILTKGLFDGARKFIACNHCRSVEFYLETIGRTEAAPVAYACEDYKSFEDGKCADCGVDGRECAQLGPHNLDYKKFIADPSRSTGKRFFMSTMEHDTFFGFQYLVKIVMAEESDDYVAQHGKISLEFFEKHGKGQIVPFNAEDHIFHYGRTYDRVVVLDIDPDELDHLQFKWSHGANAMHWDIYINSVDIKPLSFKNFRLHSNETRFVSDNKKIGNNHGVVFHRK